MRYSRMAGKVLAAVAILGLTGCAGQNLLIQQTGNALALSYAEIKPQYELGLKARAASPEQTIGEFLAANHVSPITTSEMAFMLNTSTEHQETIQALQHFGQETK